MMRAIRRLQFCAGHRVMGHENKCAHLHGHNYVVFLHAEAIQDTLDSIGRVVDFGVLKYIYGTFIEECWDHGFILHRNDAPGRAALNTFDIVAEEHEDDEWEGAKLFLLDENPTAENMAKYLLHDETLKDQLAEYGVRLVRVVLWETENCYADVSA